ncbi:MAG: DoxX family membrane protein [Cyclobacteriaceae bacterium]|nr:DoxX family membrane protein [Cyclobacteriaceae bacterium]
MITPTFILRLVLAIILLVHSVPGMFNGGVNAFGELYLNQIGFAPVGLLLAWAIKLSHVASAVLLIMNRYIKVAAIITAFILVMGIIMIHFKEGWFVVGGGRNGAEFNVLMIAVFVYLMYPNGFMKN